MYYSRTLLTEYKYSGVFFTTERTEVVNGDIIDDDRTDDEIVFNDDDIDPDYAVTPATDVTVSVEEEILYETKCDIQQSAKMFSNGTIVGDYDIFFHTEPDEKLPIKLGCIFRCEDFPIPIEGMVVGLAPTQMGCKAQIKMNKT